jgi:hypothetical protein
VGRRGLSGELVDGIVSYDERAMAKIVVGQRVDANHTDGAIWKNKPLTVDDVLASPVIAGPLHDRPSRSSACRAGDVRGVGGHRDDGKGSSGPGPLRLLTGLDPDV